MLGVAYAYVKVAVGGEDYAVVSVGVVISFGKLICFYYAGFTVCRSACVKGVDGIQNDLLFVALSALKHHAFVSGIGYDRNRIVLAELICQIREGLLQQRKFIRAVHRT